MTRKLLALFSLALLVALGASAQEGHWGGGGGLNITTVSNLSKYAQKGNIVAVTDGTSSTDCATGGGTTTVVCQYTGSSWTAVGGTGTGSVTNFTAGTLSPLFTTSVATASSTPALTFSLSNAAANSVFANCTASLGAPSYCSITAAMLPTITLAGDLSGNTGAATVVKINGVTMSGLATGILKNTTGTGAPSIAIAGDFPTLNQNTTGSAATWTTARLLAGNSTNGSADVPFANKFIVQGTTDSGLTGAQFLGVLGTGIVKNTTTTGVLSIAVAGDFPTLNQNTTGTAANLSGTPALPNGTTATTQATADSTTKLATDAFVLNSTVNVAQVNGVNNTTQTALNFITSTTNTDGLTLTPSNPGTSQVKFEATGTLNSTGGGSGLSQPAAHSLFVAEGASNYNLVTSPSTNGYYFCAFNVTGGVQVDPTCNLAGVGVTANSTNYSLLYSDRATYQKISGGTTATLTLPQVTGNTASNFPFVTQNLNSGNETLTANAADKIDNSAAGGSQTVLPNWAAWVYQDSSSAPGNWWTIRVPTFAAFGSNCGDASHALNWSTTTGLGCQSITGTAAAGGSSGQLQWNNATALGGISGWTTNGTTTVTAGATSVLDLSSMAPASGLKIPGVAGAVPTADGFIGTNLTNHTFVWGSNGTTIVGAAAATGTGIATTCSNQVISAVSSLVAPTCHTVVGGDMASNTVTATQLAVQYSKGSCTEVWGGSGTSFALTSGDDSISNNSCYNDSGVTRTITAVKCLSDNASNTTTVNPTMGSAGTGTTILTGALTCGSSNAMSSSGTVSNASWTTGTGINPAMGGVLTGTHIAMIVEYTY